MAKDNNLTDFLTDIANTIREKKGTTELINPQNFSEEIKSIGGNINITPCEFKDVNFYDYEGTILYSYTWDEFVEKNEMPPLPTHHEGLVCQGWNYTLEEVLEQGGRCDVGAIYIPEDGDTKLHIQVGKPMSTYIVFTGSQSVADGVVVDWGDGTVESINTVGKVTFSHYYNSTVWEKVISIHVNDDCKFTGVVFGNSDFMSPIKEINIGERITFGDYFSRYTVAKYVSIANTNDVKIGEFAFSPLLEFIILPKFFDSYDRIFQDSGLKNICLPNSWTLVSSNTFLSPRFKIIHFPSKITLLSGGNFSLVQKSYLVHISASKANTKLSCVDGSLIKDNVLLLGSSCSAIPEGVTSLDAYSFASTAITNILIPTSVTEIKNNAFANCKILMSIVNIPEGVKSITANSFLNCKSVPAFNFNGHTEVPTLSNVNAFSGTTGKIIVPDALYNEWVAATNWVTYASRIIKASEWIEPTNE